MSQRDESRKQSIINADKRKPEETIAGSGEMAATDRLLRIHALLDEVTSSPWSHDVLELALGTALSLRISEGDETALVWLMIVGPPSDGKTFIVLLIKGADGVYCL